VLNIGHGSGVVDSEIQRVMGEKGGSHTIVEAHPEVPNPGCE